MTRGFCGNLQFFEKKLEVNMISRALKNHRWDFTLGWLHYWDFYADDIYWDGILYTIILILNEINLYF